METTRRRAGPLAILVSLLFVRGAGLGTNADPALVAWYEQAVAYYSAVMSGAEAKPDAAAWQEFMDQMAWAGGQLGLGGPSGGWDPGAPATSRSPRVRLSFLGAGGTHDIWSQEVTLVVPSPAARISTEITTDTRTRPPEKVLKIVVTDPATGAQAVYFIHDYGNASIDVQTPKPGAISGPTRSLKTSVFAFRKPGPPPGMTVRRKTPTPMQRPAVSTPP